MTDIIKGLDVSNWQGAMTSAALDGYRPQFAVIKATEGHTWHDPFFRQNLSLMQSYGVPILGAYHRLRHGDPTGQLDNFQSVVRDPRGLIVMVDVEESDLSFDDVSGWYDGWNRRTDHYPCVLYTGDWFWMGKRWGAGSNFGPLWAAPNRGYPGPRFNDSDWHAGYGGWNDLTIAQYATNKALGDMDYYRGTVAQMAAALTRGGQGAPTPPTGGFVHTYTVRPGDNLHIISLRVYGTAADWEVIALANPQISDPNIIHPGDVLTIPALAPTVPQPEQMRHYTVHAGDTLSHIADLFYHNPDRWRSIFQANRRLITDPNLIRPGWELNIP